MRRSPAVAGTFYPRDPSTLERDVRALLAEEAVTGSGASARQKGSAGQQDLALETGSRDEGASARPAVAVLAPHAGYIYSGPCAGRTYREVIVPDRAIVLCPNHTGLGRPLAVMAEGEWETPIGPVPIDRALARRLLDLDPDLADDALAHAREHALEVQLPFLRILNPALRIVPVCVGTRRLDSLLALGDAIAAAVRESAGGRIGAAAQDATDVGEPLATDLAEEMIVGSSPMPEARWATTDAGATEPPERGRRDQILVVISSDMSHYIPFEEARELDAMAIERMEELDAEGLHSVVEREEISMCGAMPAVAGLRAARVLGASRGRLVAYTSSGDRTGDYREVVAYAGMVFH